MPKGAFTTNGQNRFLVLEIDKVAEIEEIPRFVGGDAQKGSDGNYKLGPLSGGETVHLKDFIVYVGGKPGSPVEIEGVLYSQPFKVFDRDTFNSIFRSQPVVR